MKHLAKVVCWLACGSASVALAAGRGDEVVVIYNSRMPESRELAYYYAQRRDVPTNQVFGFDLPTTEAIKRSEFHDGLPKPLLIQGHPLHGPARNSTYGVTNAALLQPTNGVLMVARLDGPSVEIARGLVDKATE